MTTDNFTHVEHAKLDSRHLAGDIAPTLRDTTTDGFSADDQAVIKHHGIYQQQNRDTRGKGGPDDKPPASFMVRTRIPGGVLTAAQYLAHDDLADTAGNGTLRITTRQGLQLHGVPKGDLTATVRAINDTLLTTLAACGDVVRNIILSPAPPRTEAEQQVLDLARELSVATLPRTRAYHEIWINGEPREELSPAEPPAEPLYGDRYLPRKFKIAMALPGDNSTDVFAHDLGIVALIRRNTLEGFTLLVGGGLGMTHKKPDTFPRLADPFATVAPGELIDTVLAIVRVFRDHGDRTNRKHARLKYIIHEKGVQWLRDAVAADLGRELAPPQPLPVLLPQLHLGWHRQADGRWFVGLFVENGRIRNSDESQFRSGLRAVIERVQPTVRLTPHQDIVLADIADADRAQVEDLLAAHGIRPADAYSKLRRHSMACPALPTCGLAITEAERQLPEVIDELEAELVRLDLADELITVRMTGCPNGCARPYVADVGLVGRSLNKYTLFVGGRSDGTRLNQAYADLVPADRIVSELRPLLELWRVGRLPGESFGDWSDRLGIEELQSRAAEWKRVGRNSGRAVAVGV
ncbi:MAG: NADPH-dependent assimilatory sulfite reductase hemoprotein subunit [Planctomycetota bacterium]